VALQARHESRQQLLGAGAGLALKFLHQRETLGGVLKVELAQGDDAVQPSAVAGAGAVGVQHRHPPESAPGAGSEGPLPALARGETLRFERRPPRRDEVRRRKAVCRLPSASAFCHSST
jgi:hypothetical protein